MDRIPVSLQLAMERPAGRVAAVVMLALVFAGPARAQFGDASVGNDASPHSDAQLLSYVSWIQPGKTFTVALRLQMDRGWHSYWKNPGDSGGATSVRWAIPEGFKAGKMRWPYPQRIETGPFVSYGYVDEVLLLSRITPPEDLPPGTSVTLEGRAEWLICADVCLPAEAPLRLTLPVRSAAPAPGEGQAAIDAAKGRLPRPLPDVKVRTTRADSIYTLSITPAETPQNAYFFPAQRSVIAHAAPQRLSKEGAGFIMTLKPSAYAQGPVERLQGVLVILHDRAPDAKDSVRAVEIDSPVR